MNSGQEELETKYLKTIPCLVRLFSIEVPGMRMEALCLQILRTFSFLTNYLHMTQNNLDHSVVSEMAFHLVVQRFLPNEWFKA